MKTSDFDDGAFWLSHFSLGRRVWEYLIFVVSLITPVEMTFMLIFIRDISIRWYQAFFIFDVLQIIDLFVMIHTPFLRFGVLIYDRHEIIKHYGKFKLGMDCIACIPMGWIGLVMKNRTVYVILSLNRFLRLHHVYTSYVTITDSQLYGAWFAKIFTNIVVFFFWIHLWACVFFAVAISEGLENSWIAPFADRGFTNAQYYIVSFYYILNTFTTVGFGYLHPRTLYEELLSILLMITGATIVTMIISSMVGSMIDHNRDEYLISFRLNQQFYRFRHFDHELVSQLNNYWQYMWTSHRGYSNWSIMLHDLPDGLVHRLKMDFCNRVFAGLELFRGLPDRFLVSLSEAIEPFSVIFGDIIFVQGSAADCVTLINSGIISLVLDGTVFATHRISNFYVDGAQNLIFNGTHRVTMKASSFVDGFIMKREVLFDMLRANAHLKSIILQNARDLYPEEFARLEVNAFWAS